jgi:hypothetical protein
MRGIPVLRAILSARRAELRLAVRLLALLDATLHLVQEAGCLVAEILREELTRRGLLVFPSRLLFVVLHHSGSLLVH